jgi:hypothetical protein
VGIELCMYLGPYVECPRTAGSPHRYDIVEDEMFDISTGDKLRLYFAPNVWRDGYPRNGVKWDDAVCFDLQDVSPADEMAWLRSAFAVEIAALEKAYGAVTFRWGLCQWWA